MFRGIKDYLLAVRQILQSSALRAWFSSVLLRGAVLGIIVLVVAVTGGAWWIATLGESAWFDLGAVAWVLALIYFSGAIFGMVMALGLPIFIREGQLVKAVSGHSELRLTKLKFGDHLREVSSSLVSVFVSLLAWPLLLIPPLLPIGVLLMSWAYAREASATSLRIGKEFAGHVRIREREPTKGYLLGLGLIPSILSIVPFAAFFVWPTLLVSGLSADDDGKD
jgi:hypothetical protein